MRGGTLERQDTRRERERERERSECDDGEWKQQQQDMYIYAYILYCLWESEGWSRYGLEFAMGFEWYIWGGPVWRQFRLE